MSEISKPTDLPPPPKFIGTGNFAYYSEQYQGIMQDLEALLVAHKAGEAMTVIVYELMPSYQNYQLDYVQGTNANQESAANYALSMVNYISQKFSDINTDMQTDNTDQEDTDAGDALYAEYKLQYYINHNGNYFGSMGSSVMSQLHSATAGSNYTYYNSQQHNTPPTTTNADSLAEAWVAAWTMTESEGTNSSSSSGSTSSSNPSGPQGAGINANAPIMQAFQGAQNQAQSEAAYVQTLQKQANQSDQEFSSSQEDVERNIVDVEKAANQAAQSSNS